MYLKILCHVKDNSQLFCFLRQCILNKTFESVLRHGIRLDFTLDNPAFRQSRLYLIWKPKKCTRSTDTMLILWSKSL
jgi:hypothetical protein